MKLIAILATAIVAVLLVLILPEVNLGPGRGSVDVGLSTIVNGGKNHTPIHLLQIQP